MSYKLEFDESVSESVKSALERRKKVSIDPTNILVGDLVRLYPEDGGDHYTFRCVARRHDMTPDPLHPDDDEDEVGDSRLVFVLGDL